MTRVRTSDQSSRAERKKERKITYLPLSKQSSSRDLTRDPDSAECSEVRADRRWCTGGAVLAGPAEFACPPSAGARGGAVTLLALSRMETLFVSLIFFVGQGAGSRGSERIRAAVFLLLVGAGAGAPALPLPRDTGSGTGEAWCGWWACQPGRDAFPALAQPSLSRAQVAHKKQINIFFMK